MTHAPITTVVFDLGNVLIEWEPRLLYRDLFKGDDAAMELFLSDVCNQAWNHRHDEGVTFAANAAALKQQHPADAAMIDAYFPGFGKMLKGPIVGTVELLRALDATGVPLYALSNWSAETFPIARARFDFLNIFRGIVMSGEEKVAKPDARIFQILLDRYSIDPRATLFIDDVAANIAAASALGFHTHLFTSPEILAAELHRLNLLPLQRCA